MDSIHPWSHAHIIIVVAFVGFLKLCHSPLAWACLFLTCLVPSLAVHDRVLGGLPAPWNANGAQVCPGQAKQEAEDSKNTLTAARGPRRLR